jgi:hypothetical protein
MKQGAMWAVPWMLGFVKTKMRHNCMEGVILS